MVSLDEESEGSVYDDMDKNLQRKNSIIFFFMYQEMAADRHKISSNAQ